MNATLKEPDKTTLPQETKGLILGTLAVIAFGLTLPATRYVVPYLDPIFIGLGRACVASIVAATLLIVARQPLPNRQQIPGLVLVALGVVIGFPVLSAWAMQTAPASHGGVILGILPLATAIMGALVTKERPSTGFWITGILGAIIVVVFSLFASAEAVTSDLQFSDLLLVAAVASAAVGYAVGGKLAKQLGGWQVICWALLIALPFIIVPTWLYMPDTTTPLPISVLLAFIYLALVSQLMGFFLWYHALAIGGVARVSQTQLLQPFITIIASAWLLSEVIETSTIVFAMLVVSIVVISKRMPVHTNS